MKYIIFMKINIFIAKISLCEPVYLYQPRIKSQFKIGLQLVNVFLGLHFTYF